MAGPEMVPGIPGDPVVMVLVCGALFPQLPTAITETVEPPGIEAGNWIEQLGPAGVITDPGTLHDQMYDVAPLTGAMEKLDDCRGQTNGEPLIGPGTVGVLTISMYLTGVL